MIASVIIFSKNDKFVKKKRKWSVQKITNLVNAQIVE